MTWYEQPLPASWGSGSARGGNMPIRFAAAFLWLLACVAQPALAQTAQGLQGVHGLQPIQGARGLQAVQGAQGAQAVQGVRGLQAVQGLQGLEQRLAGMALENPE